MVLLLWNDTAPLPPPEAPPVAPVRVAAGMTGRDFGDDTNACVASEVEWNM